jgi:hypothetical protein
MMLLMLLASKMVGRILRTMKLSWRLLKALLVELGNRGWK